MCLVTIMTPATSVFFVGSEFNDFLYASIGDERNEMPLSVLSALARLNVDPWKEAAELSELPTDAATQRLASLIGRLPHGRWAQADSGAIADRLVELLPHRASTKVSSAEKAHGLREMTGSALTIMLICAALGIIVLIIAANGEPSSRGHHADVPAFGTASPSQTQ